MLEWLYVRFTPKKQTLCSCFMNEVQRMRFAVLAVVSSVMC